MTGVAQRDPSPARICVAGAGAIGLVLAARLAMAGNAVTVVARGSTLAALRAEGIVLGDREGSRLVPVLAASKPEWQPQDVVILAAKAQDLPAIAALARPAIGPATMVVPAVNGIPWWYFEGTGGADDGRVIEAVDPGGRLQALLPAAQLVGTATYITSERTAPNAALTFNPLRMTVGPVTPAARSGAARVAGLLQSAGIATQLVDDIRTAVWAKVIRNLSTNPLSVVAGATLREIFADPLLAPLARATIEEARAVAAAYGATVSMDADEVVKLGDVRTSMLQDYERGRPLELAAIGDAVVELARHKGMGMAHTCDILALARFRMAKAQALAGNPPPLPQP
ncbi:ketopantoate reductase family protein [Xanthobacter agilis]|uniref:2-dehydropantoate 2-reductase n=1 Tax=Xanthobacter agilis TaxID=47492 RepID=A0ABU0LJK6_XANAG|nr:2-dehydropantoate 2-reductase [Xanthobacter agilis]MDQ0507326.1 2-dehydropantoate 2-reductase [Xanthobacter agilis]